MLELPGLGAGAYHVEVRAWAADGDEVELRQDPAFVVEAPGAA